MTSIISSTFDGIQSAFQSQGIKVSLNFISPKNPSASRSALHTKKYAVFETEDRNIKSFKEKPNYTYYANAGIYLFKKELLNLIPKGKVYNATDFMNDVISSRKQLVHYPIRGYWLDIGKHKDFEKAQKDISHINFD